MRAAFSCLPLLLSLRQVLSEGFGVLVVGGFYGGAQVHLFKSLSDETGCAVQSMPERASTKALAGFMNEEVTVCGGGMKHCYALQGNGSSQGWVKAHQLDAMFATLTLTYDNDVWTVIGAMDHVEEIWEWRKGNSDGFEQHSGPSLEKNPCATRFNQSHSIVGKGGKKMFWYEERDNSFMQWEYNEERRQVEDAACGLLFIPDQGYQFVSAGGEDLDSGDPLSLTEVFDFQANEWFEVQHLPRPMRGSTCVQYQNTFILIGGRDTEGTHQTLDTVLLYLPQEGWTVMPMKHARDDYNLGAIHVTANHLTCL